MFSIDEKVLQLFSFLMATLGGPGYKGPAQGLTAAVKQEIAAAFEDRAFNAGRFANALQREDKSKHALQVIQETTTSSFVLALNADGTATVCRGWQYLGFNSGPEVNQSERIREQLGYRGFWHRNPDDGWVDIDLSLDDRVCDSIGEYSNLVPRHAAKWQLRCFPFLLKGMPGMEEPLLACRMVNGGPDFGEGEPHTVFDPATQQYWLLLGAENGIRIKTGTTGDGKDSLPGIQVTQADSLLSAEAWRYPF
ncbi:hypothetical protein [Taibaiella chishuiensis]|uniref:Uncharacterized protein n=1 Tax=Taibaiella chishuiensis TaxID=1434707 RepID=A0A2P8D878_9BACT|nr:hypothetical protein [Taibaiella chishuiensis]PSK93426.1 hypothetical protein B0I18_102396 [Taibaiella chishuiensis]